MNPARVLRTLLAERLGQTAGRWPRELFGKAETPTLRQAISERVSPPALRTDTPEALLAARAPDAGQSGAGNALTVSRERVPLRGMRRTQETYDTERADAYWAGRDDFPPILVARETDGSFTLFDGHNRTRIGQRRGLANMDAYVVPRAELEARFARGQMPEDITAELQRVNAPDGGASGAGNVGADGYARDARGWRIYPEPVVQTPEMSMQRMANDAARSRALMLEREARRAPPDGFVPERNTSPRVHRIRLSNGSRLDLSVSRPDANHLRQITWDVSGSPPTNTREILRAVEQAVRRELDAHPNARYDFTAETASHAPLYERFARSFQHPRFGIRRVGDGYIIDRADLRAPDAPNAGPRVNGSTLAALAALPPGALTLRELLRDRYGAA